MEEFLRELNFIYRRDRTGNYFRLDRRGATDRSDLKVVRAIVSLLDRRHYGAKPLHYDDVHSELVKMFCAARRKHNLISVSSDFRCSYP